MKKNFKALQFFIGLIIGLIFSAIIVSVIFVYNQPLYVENLLTENYDGDIDEDYFDESIVSGMVAGLNDPHSSYIYSEDVDDFNQLLETENEGIGIYINIDQVEGAVQITGVIEGGGASDQEIYAGDYIKSVNGTIIDESNAENVADLIKENQSTELVVYRPSTDEELDFTVENKGFTVPSVTSQIINHDSLSYGYIKLSSFSDTTADEFKEQLEVLEESNIQGLIIDVRDNGGGYVTAVEGVLDEIVTNDKPILITKKDDVVVDELYTNNDEVKSYNIIGLINGNSASASEILSASLRDINGYDLVGETTYGKGSVQQIIPIPGDKYGSIRLTIEHWFTPNDETIDGVGIKPTIKVIPDESAIYFGPFILEQNISLNDQSFDALRVNQYLDILGYDVDSTSYTYNQKTMDAISDFQSENGLESTGIFDVQSAEILEKQATEYEHDYEYDNYVQTAIDNM